MPPQLQRRGMVFERGVLVNGAVVFCLLHLLYPLATRGISTRVFVCHVDTSAIGTLKAGRAVASEATETRRHVQSLWPRVFHGVRRLLQQTGVRAPAGASGETVRKTCM